MAVCKCCMKKEKQFSAAVFMRQTFFADLTVLDAFTMYCVISQQNDTMLSLLGIMLDMFALLLLSLACRIFFFFFIELGCELALLLL